MFRCFQCWVKMVHLYVIYPTVHLSIVASKSSWNSLVSFMWIANVNKEMYIDILCCVRDVIKRKHSKNWRTNSWFLLHDNAPAHQSVSVKISSQRTKWNVTDMIFNFLGQKCNWQFKSTLLSSRRSRCLPVPLTEIRNEVKVLLWCYWHY